MIKPTTRTSTRLGLGLAAIALATAGCGSSGIRAVDDRDSCAEDCGR